MWILLFISWFLAFNLWYERSIFSFVILLVWGFNTKIILTKWINGGCGFSLVKFLLFISARHEMILVASILEYYLMSCVLLWSMYKESWYWWLNSGTFSEFSLLFFGSRKRKISMKFFSQRIWGRVKSSFIKFVLFIISHMKCKMHQIDLSATLTKWKIYKQP